MTLTTADVRAMPMADDGPVGPRVDRPRRRAFPAEYKAAVLAEYDALAEPGARGALRALGSPRRSAAVVAFAAVAKPVITHGPRSDGQGQPAGHAVTSYRSLVKALLGPAREERPAGRTTNVEYANHRVDEARRPRSARDDHQAR